MGARGIKPMTFDCGSYGHLTAAQISELANINQGTVYDRAASGVRGEALCAPVKKRTGYVDKEDHWPVPAMDLCEQLSCVQLRKWRGPVNDGPLVATMGWRAAA